MEGRLYLDNAYLAILIIVALFSFLTLLVWLDWTYKCWKSAKENGLTSWLPCYFAVRCIEPINEVIVMDGILGVNEKNLVFANRFKDDALYVIREASSISSFDTTEYNNDAFLDFIYNGANNDNKITTYFFRSMMGMTSTKKLPKSLMKRTICFVQFSDEECNVIYKSRGKKCDDAVEIIEEIFTVDKYCFFVKRTEKHIATMMRILDVVKGV
jgi:hypothetical protein